MKAIFKAYKYRLYPNKEQIELVNKTIGCYRYIFNYYLNKKIEIYKSKQKSLSKFDCINDMQRTLKYEYIWLKEVDSLSLQQSLYDLDVAYQNFFRRVKNGEKELGFPKFKSRKNNKQTYRTQFVKTTNGGNIKIINNKIQLPKLGLVTFANSKKFNGIIKSCTISRTPTNKYFVSISAEEEIKELPYNNSVIGFDLGLKEFLTTSDGEIVNNPRILKQYENKLTKLQRQLSSKTKGSNRYKKQSKKVAKLHEKISNIRTDFLQKLSTQIIKENQLIISEDLNVKDMMQNHKLAKSISDVSWSEFMRMLEYKSIWNDRIYHKIDRYYASSQLCSICGYKNAGTKDSGVREWICPKCNTQHNRDLNAAINILKQGLKELDIVI